jgi:hypothetical protein
MGLIALFQRGSKRVTPTVGRADIYRRRRQPMLQLQTNDPPVVDSNLLIGIRNALLIEVGVVALIVLLYWLF